MIIRGKPYCDECQEKLIHLTEEEMEADYEQNMVSHGFPWKRASRHYCFECAEKIMDDHNYPPCDGCRTRPCDRHGDCWASPPLHLFPYETYVAEKWWGNIQRIQAVHRTLDVYLEGIP